MQGVVSELEMISLGDLARRNEAELVAESDENAHQPDYWDKYPEAGTQMLGDLPLGISYPGVPTVQSMVGDGVFDPFDAMPIGGCAKYNGRVLDHCQYLLRSTCLFGHGRFVTQPH